MRSSDQPSSGMTHASGSSGCGARSVVVALRDNTLCEQALGRIGGRFAVLKRADQLEVVEQGCACDRGHGDGELAAHVPPCCMESLGDPSFTADHGLRYPCMSGAMANGIGSVEVVEAMGRAGFLGSFGAAGLAPAVVERAIDRIQGELGQATPYAMNLIHSLGEPALEATIVGLYLRRRVRLVEASAFLGLTLPVVRYRVTGIRREGSGRVVAPNRIIAKVSRVEVASKFMAPPPDRFLRELVAAGDITHEQAEWAS